jgi:YHS domain-containing protein
VRRIDRVLVAAALCLAATVLVATCGSSVRAQGEDQPDWAEGLLIGLPTYVLGDPPETPRVMYKDSTVSINNYCPVRVARLDPKRKPVYVNGKPVGFCCTPCPVTFSMDPEKYLRALKVSLPCPVRPSRRAILDSSLRARINHDIYFFSSLSAMRQFKKAPLRYCGKLTDPVSFERFEPTKESPHIVYRDRDYYFGSDSTRIRFQAEPEKWFARRTSH